MSFFISAMPEDGLMSSPPRIEAHALAHHGDARVLRIAPDQLDQARGMAARGGAADGMDHRVVALQHIPGEDVDLRVMRLGERPRLGFELRRPHVFGGRVDEIAHHGDRRRLGQRRIDRLGILGQQHARFAATGILAVAVETVLAGDPAVQRLASLSVRQPVGAAGQGFGELRQAPAGERRAIGNAAGREPAIAIGQDRDFAGRAFELLRGQDRALAGGARLLPCGEGRLVDQVERGGGLSPVRLDQCGLVQGVRSFMLRRTLPQPCGKRERKLR
jgi:hypothetical protein